MGAPGKEYCGKGFFDKDSLRILIGTVLFTTILILLVDAPDIRIIPDGAIYILIGLLFGPFGSLGAAIAGVIVAIIGGETSIVAILARFVTVFLVSYFPYKLWYSTLLKDGNAEQPMLNTVWNVSKFFAVIVVSALVDMVLFHILEDIIIGYYASFILNLIELMTVLTLSLVYGFAAIIFLRYWGIDYCSPKRDSAYTGILSKVKPWMFNVALAISIIVPSMMLDIDSDGQYFAYVAIVTYLFLAIFLLKPMKAPRETAPGAFKGKFNDNLIERIIVIFLLAAIAISIVVVVCTYSGIVIDVLGLGPRKTVLFYLGAALMVFFVPAMWFLWYIETRISVPLTEISHAAEAFVREKGITGGSDSTKEVYGRFTGLNSEIGGLATSLTGMTDEIEDYVNNIRELEGAKDKLERELAIAQGIQNSFIPMDFDAVNDKGVHIHASMTPAKYVGGDLYDFFMIDEDHMAFLIGDVSGKGVPAALFMAMTQVLVESHAYPGRHIEEVITHVNDKVCNDENMFVTAWMGIIDVRTGLVEFVNAGHNPPLIRRKGQPSELLKTRPGLVLGGMEDITYKKFVLQLEPGDRILLYTDGVTEANSDYHGFYGEDRLIGFLDSDRDRSVKEDVDSLRQDVLSFTGDSDQFDDITILELEYVGME